MAKVVQGFSMSPETLERLREVAWWQRRSASALVEEAVKAALAAAKGAAGVGKE